MRIYLAGAMTGIKDHNFPLFDHVTEQLRQQGHDVFNPAELTKSVWGSLARFIEMSPNEQLDSSKALLAKELSWICLNAEALFLLPGWELSAGARAEYAAAFACKIPYFLVPEKMLTNLQV